MEEDINSEQAEVATQDQQSIPDQQVQQQPAQDNYQERNWRAMREEKSRLERENREKDELIRDLVKKHSAPVVEEEPELPDDEYLNKGHVKRLAKKEVEPLKKEIEELRSHLANQRQQNLFDSLRKKFTDFDDVVNPETLALFDEREPELAAQIVASKDPYAIGVQSYKFIKASGLLDSVPSRRRQKEADKMLEKNAKTMQSPQAYDKRPMAQAFKMTEEDKSRLYDEMMGFASQAGSIPELGAF